MCQSYSRPNLGRFLTQFIGLDQIWDDDTIHECPTSAKLFATPHCVASLCCNSSKPLVLSYFDTLPLSNLFNNLTRLVLLNILWWNSHASCRKRIRVVNSRQVKPTFHIQNRTLLECTKTHANWWRIFEALSIQRYSSLVLTHFV